MCWSIFSFDRFASLSVYWKFAAIWCVPFHLVLCQVHRCNFRWSTTHTRAFGEIQVKMSKWNREKEEEKKEDVNNNTNSFLTKPFLSILQIQNKYDKKKIIRFSNTDSMQWVTFCCDFTLQGVQNMLNEAFKFSFDSIFCIFSFFVVRSFEKSKNYKENWTKGMEKKRKRTKQSERRCVLFVNSVSIFFFSLLRCDSFFRGYWEIADEKICALQD